MASFIGKMSIAPAWLLDRAAAKTKSPGSEPTKGSERPPEPTLPRIDLRVRYATERLLSGIVAPAIQGRGGARACLMAAIEIVRGCCVTTGDGRGNRAFDVLWNTYNPVCAPPWTMSEADQNDLLHKISDAELKSGMSWRWRLDYRLALAWAIGEIDRSDICQARDVATDVMTESADEVRRAGTAALGGEAQPASADARPRGECLIDRLSPLPLQARTPSPTPAEVTTRIEQLAATMPSRSSPVPKLLQLLHSSARDIAENGPRPGKSPESRAFIVALGCVYATADLQSTTDLLLSCKGGMAVQQARNPNGYGMQIWLDAWRYRDVETDSAAIMIVDAVLVDAHPCGRAQSRMTVYLRPVEQPKRPESQLRYDMPVSLGAPHAGELSGEFLEARSAFEAGTAPERRDRKVVTEAWVGALVRVVLAEDEPGVRSVRHLLPLEADRRDEVRAVLAVCSAFSIIAAPNSTGVPR